MAENKNSQTKLRVEEFFSYLPSFLRFFADAAQICGRDIEKRSYIFERKQLEQIGMIGNQTGVASFRRLAIECEISVVGLIKYQFCGFCNKAQ